MKFFRLSLILFCISLSASAEIEIDENGYPFEYAHATMSDGVKIALAIGYPKDFDPEDTSRKYPAVLAMSGYGRQTKPTDPEPYESLYVTVNASLRGTGASEGTFSIFSDRSSQDGQ